MIGWNKKQTSDGWLQTFKKGAEDYIDFKTYEIITSPKERDDLGKWMEKENITYLKVGALEIKKKITDKKNE